MLQFYSQIAAIAISLLLMYAALKWFHFGFIQKKAQSFTAPVDRRKFIRKQCELRFILLAVAIIVDILVYLFANYETALWLCLMVVLCMPFVVATKKRVDSDYDYLYNDKEEECKE